jgi:hypothetical protein
LSYNVVPIFSEECLNTIELSKYPITTDFIFSNSEQMKKVYEMVKNNHESAIQLLNNCKTMAHVEKAETLHKFKQIIYGQTA